VVVRAGLHGGWVPERGVLDEEERVVWWRQERLVEAGFEVGAAWWLALDPEVDLHRAVELAAVAGPEVAFRILV
jgi:hypothetical protein